MAWTPQTKPSLEKYTYIFLYRPENVTLEREKKRKIFGIMRRFGHFRTSCNGFDLEKGGFIHTHNKYSTTEKSGECYFAPPSLQRS